MKTTNTVAVPNTVTNNVTPEQAMRAQLEALLAENAALKAKAQSRQATSLKVSAKGAVSVYGLGKWPVTLYAAQMSKLLSMAPEITPRRKSHPDLITGKDDPRFDRQPTSEL